MGYTHHWTVDKHVSDKRWEGFCGDVRKILDSAPVKIVRELDRVDEPPEITDTCVAFNGPDDDGHETFFVDRNQAGYAFCKTARKPYDVVVVACWLAGRKNGVFSDIYSDGDDPEHDDGRALYNQAVFG